MPNSFLGPFHAHTDDSELLRLHHHLDQRVDTPVETVEARIQLIAELLESCLRVIAEPAQSGFQVPALLLESCLRVLAGPVVLLAQRVLALG